MLSNSSTEYFEYHVRNALKSCELAPGKRLVIAVSGGPDSLAMLHAIYRLRKIQRLELYGAHLDHCIRGSESEADASFVADIFQEMGIDFTIERKDVPSFGKAYRLSIEEAARKVRYEFLSRIALQQQAAAVAVGHTASDQVETVLMNILRGTGLAGLRGMKPRTQHTFAGNEVLIVRPLLNLSRQDTENYCQTRSLNPRLDKSNLSSKSTRNRIRLELLPLLEKFNPSVQDALTKLSHSATRDDIYLENVVDTIWPTAIREEHGQVIVDKTAYRRLDETLRIRLLRRAAAHVKGDLNEIKYSHIIEIADMMTGATGRTICLPKNVRFTSGYREGFFSRQEPDVCALPSLKGNHLLNIPGQTQICDWSIEAKILEQCKEDNRRGKWHTAGSKLKYAPNGLTANLGQNVLGSRTWVRVRQPGDRFQPLGMSQTKKLQDFMVDAKVPKQLRDRVPLVVSEHGIAWVVGWRIAEWAKVTAGMSRQLEICFLDACQRQPIGFET